jgi:predicted glycosyltransferase
MLRVAFYSHDTYGLGHLRRCLKIANALVRHFGSIDGLILTGSPWAERFARPEGFRYVALPPVVKTGPDTYCARDASIPLDKLLGQRRLIVGDAIARLRPDLLIVDNVPCGLAGEILPVLDDLNRTGSGRAVLALRDVIDDETTVSRQWKISGAFAAIESRYDEVWVFGPPDCPVARTLPKSFSTSVVYCGYLDVDDRSSTPHHPFIERLQRLPARPRILVTGGGGGDAQPLIETYVDLLATKRPTGTHRLVLGPDYPSAHQLCRSDLTDLGVQIVAFDPNLPAAMADSDVVVSMAGYNTVCEALALGRRLVLVPRVWPRREQWMRARTLADQGRAAVVSSDALTPLSLWLALASSLTGPPPAPMQAKGGIRAAARAACLLGLATVA